MPSFHCGPTRSMRWCLAAARCRWWPKGAAACAAPLACSGLWLKAQAASRPVCPKPGYPTPVLFIQEPGGIAPAQVVGDQVGAGVRIILFRLALPAVPLHAV